MESTIRNKVSEYCAQLAVSLAVSWQSKPREWYTYVYGGPI